MPHRLLVASLGDAYASRIAAHALQVSVVPRTIRVLDRFQQRHAWAGFPVAVAKKYGDDEAESLAALLRLLLGVPVDAESDRPQVTIGGSARNRGRV